MPARKPTPLVAKIEAAHAAISAADVELDALMRDVQAAPRAQKTIASPVVLDAFLKLKAAKATLQALQLQLEPLLGPSASAPKAGAPARSRTPKGG